MCRRRVILSCQQDGSRSGPAGDGEYTSQLVLAVLCRGPAPYYFSTQGAPLQRKRGLKAEEIEGSQNREGRERGTLKSEIAKSSLESHHCLGASYLFYPRRRPHPPPSGWTRASTSFS